MQKALPLFLLLFLSLGLSAQNNERFYSELDKAWQSGNVKSMAVLFDDEVEFSREGREGKLSRRQVEGELANFFAGSVPKSFVLKHKGSSQDGQLYFIGQLETNTGSQFKIVCRAKPVQTGYRIFRLDVNGG